MRPVLINLSEYANLRKKKKEIERKMNYEQEISALQNLTFDFAGGDPLCSSVLAASRSVLKTEDADDRYLNLALWLSDQNPMAITVARFLQTERNESSERRVFTGSILKQLEDCLAFLLSDIAAYPPQAVRETMRNCICHRDYSNPCSTQISIFPDRMEFISIGGLPESLDEKSIELGIAMPRNPNLANLLYSMNIIQNYGTGLEKICSLYRNQRRQPLFQAAKGVFKTTLFNMAFTQEEKRRKAFFVSEKDQIVQFANEQGFITRRQVEELLESGPTKAYSILMQLCDSGLLRQEKSGRNSAYVPFT